MDINVNIGNRPLATLKIVMDAHWTIYIRNEYVFVYFPRFKAVSTTFGNLKKVMQLNIIW